MNIIPLENIKSSIVFYKIHGKNQIWDTRNTWNFIGNPRKYHGFMYISRGSVVITDKNGDVETFHEGQLIYIPKHFEYHILFARLEDGTGVTCDTVINFQMSDVEEGEVCFSNKAVCVIEHTPKPISDLMARIAHTFLNLRAPHLSLSRLLYELIEKIVLNVSHPMIMEKSESVVSPAVLYLDSHIADNVPIPALAKMCLLSVSAFRKAFKEYTGMSPVQYRMYTKIAKAKQLLDDSDSPTVKQVALALGFDDETYFYRVFCKFTGMTPNEYRTTK